LGKGFLSLHTVEATTAKKAVDKVTSSSKENFFACMTEKCYIKLLNHQEDDSWLDYKTILDNSLTFKVE